MTASKKNRKKPARASRAEAEEAIRTLISWIGEDPDREGLVETPRRVVRSFEEYFAGYAIDPADILSRTFTDVGGYTDPVLLKDIEMESRCEHHMAPFIGHAHVAYIPNGRVLGLSKLARLVDMYSRRMQTQERLTREIAGALEKHLKPKGVAVMIEAEHFCMKVRGVRKDHAQTVTTHFSGAYRKDAEMRTAFFAQVKG
ncbi:MAG: GTP cyclohydrolase I FolE [Alphaproteobacteria bacterium]|nr:GTP cyclohydrolase I FolE [Alphaproteobacteria bacterium]